MQPEGTVAAILGRDGTSVILLDTKGQLRRVGLPDMAETATTDEQAACAGFALVQSGLAVAVSDSGISELRLRDETTLQLRQRWPLPAPPRTLLASPQSLRVLVLTKPGGALVCHIATGAVEHAYERFPVPDSFSPDTPRSAVLAGDGTRLFVLLGDRLCRYRVGEDGLVPDGVADQRLASPGLLSADAEGRYVAVDLEGVVDLSLGWNPPPPMKGRNSRVLVVFETTTLAPVYQVPWQGSSQVVFDRANGWLVGNNLARYLADGQVVQRTYPSPFGRPGFTVAGHDAWGAAIGVSGNQLYRLRFVPAMITFDQMREVPR